MTTPHTTIYLALSDRAALDTVEFGALCSHTATDRPSRFGFIVAKTVGIAVERNLVRRRLKSIGHESLGLLPAGTDVVIRALPGAAQVDWDTLRSEVLDAVGGSVSGS